MQEMILQYFVPKTIEKIGDRIIYEFLGIKWYKKYLPTSGDLVMQRRKEKQIVIDKSNRYQELYKYEKKTRNYELRHIFGAILFVIVGIIIDKNLSVLEWIFLSILNLFINIYPIFLQRYNRIRIIELLEKSGRSSPYPINNK